MRPVTVAIVPAAGSGTRLGARSKKPFVNLRGTPLVVHALRRLNSSSFIDSIVVAADPSSVSRMKNIIKRYRIGKASSVVAGGKTRAGSVKNCFKAIKMPCDIVLIHDGARPFLSERLIRSSIISASRYGACITAVPEIDTVKLAGKDLFVKRTLDRSGLWRAQTPQAFKYGILRKAVLASDRSGSITDDASMVERTGRKARIIEGDARNIKVTTREDLKLAEVLLCA